MNISPDQLKAARLASGLSVMQAAALVHVDKRTWQRYEAGTSQIPGAISELFAIKTNPQRSLAMSVWRPIETAPNDGTFFLMARPGREPVVVNKPKPCSRGIWHKINGKWCGMAHGGDGTHWMPIKPLGPETHTNQG